MTGRPLGPYGDPLEPDPEKKNREWRETSEHYGPGTPCSKCGDPISAVAPAWTEYCSRHKDKRADYRTQEDATDA